MAKVLVVDDQKIMRESLQETLCRSGHEVKCCASGNDAIGLFEKDLFEAVITDLKMPEMTGIDLMKKIKDVRSEVPVILVTAYGTVDTAVEAMRFGAFDYVKKPFSADEIQGLVDKAVAQGRSVEGDEHSAAGKGSTPDAGHEMVGESIVMRGLKDQVRRLAQQGSTTLIMGETGTGKELVARALHWQGPRRGKPFVCVNCPALSAGLLESELFGHEKGAFTGAERPRKGRFELAGEGTILLDEVSEIDITLQAKLLRVLQERTFELVGSNEIHKTNARVVVTTNRDLEKEVREHRFRRDLYFRLNIIPVQVPPLRERRGDISLLAEEFVRRYAASDVTISDAGIKKLAGYAWPGNVRELENTVQRACALSDSKVLEPEHLMMGRIQGHLEGDMGPRSLEDTEIEKIREALDYHRGHQERAAESLGISSRTLRTKIKKYGLRKCV